MDNKYKSRKTPGYHATSLSRTRPVARIDTSLKFGPAIKKLTGGRKVIVISTGSDYRQFNTSLFIMLFIGSFLRFVNGGYKYPI